MFMDIFHVEHQFYRLIIAIWMSINVWQILVWALQNSTSSAYLDSLGDIWDLTLGHVHEYQPLFEGTVAKLTVINNLSIVFNSEQNSGKYTVWWLSKKINLKHFWNFFDKSSVKAKILPNVPRKEMIKNKQGLKFYEMMNTLITSFQNLLFQAGTVRLQSRDCIQKIWYIFGLKYKIIKNNAFNLENFYL